MKDTNKESDRRGGRKGYRNGNPKKERNDLRL